MDLTNEYVYKATIDRYGNVRKMQFHTKHGWKRIPFTSRIQGKDQAINFRWPYEID